MWSSRAKKMNERYIQIREQHTDKARQQAAERRIRVAYEPFWIVEMVPLPGNTDGEHYWCVADFLLAEYPTELSLLVANAFHNMVPKLGYDPYGKIMIGVQFVDAKAGSEIQARVSLPSQHAEFSQWVIKKKVIESSEYLDAVRTHFGGYDKFRKYVMAKKCPERTHKALDLLAAGYFQFKDADAAKRISSTLVVVPEMKKLARDRVLSIDRAVGEYIMGKC